VPARPSTRRSHSDADLSQPRVHHLDTGRPVVPATDPDLGHTTAQLSAPAITPATVPDDAVNCRDISDRSFTESADMKITAATTVGTTTTDTLPRQPASVGAASLSSVDDRSASETLQTSSLGGTGSDSKTVTTDDRRRRSDDDVAIVVEEPRLETFPDLKNTPSDEMMPSVASFQQQQQQQQQTASGQTAVETTWSCVDAAGSISVERSVDDGSAVTIRLTPADEVFYDVDLTDEEPRKFQQRPASKKKRSLIGLTVFRLLRSTCLL